MMLKGRATAEATAKYASRFPELPGNFRPALGVSVSSIGIGTYLGEPDEETDRAYEEAIKASLRGGINLIDTAVNYRFQRSERNIGKALGELVAAGEIEREQVVVATKGGYITFDGEVPPNPRAWFEEHYVKTGIVSPADLVDGSHCMTPKYIGTMLELSRRNLNLETIDIYYIHNPETQLEAVDRKEFLKRISDDFRVPRRRGGQRKDRRIWHRDLEWISRRADGARMAVARRADANRARSRRAMRIIFARSSCRTTSRCRKRSRDRTNSCMPERRRRLPPRRRSDSRSARARRCCRGSYRAGCRRSSRMRSAASKPMRSDRFSSCARRPAWTWLWSE